MITVFIFAVYLSQCLKLKEMNFLFKFGCVYKYHLSGLSTLNAVASWSPSALKSSNFVCLYTCADVWLHECMCVWLWWCANVGGQIFWQNFKGLLTKILIMMYFSSFEKKENHSFSFFPLVYLPNLSQQYFLSHTLFPNFAIFPQKVGFKSTVFETVPFGNYPDK